MSRARRVCDFLMNFLFFVGKKTAPKSKNALAVLPRRFISVYARFYIRRNSGNRGRIDACPARSDTSRPRPGAWCKRTPPYPRPNHRIHSFRNSPNAPPFSRFYFIIFSIVCKRQNCFLKKIKKPLDKQNLLCYYM